MLDRTKDAANPAEAWLAQFEDALAKPDEALLKTLFHPDSYWRDVLALSWDIRPSTARTPSWRVGGPCRAGRPAGFAIDPDRAAPRKVTRAGTSAIEAIFKFETAVGPRQRHRPADSRRRGRRHAESLDPADDAGGTERIRGTARNARPRGEAYSRDFRGPNWLDLRKSAADYADRDPDVLVVGGGQAGLSIAARLQAIEPGYADRRPRGARRRQLAQPLSRADAAQPGAGQPPALHAVSAELADLYPQGQARQLVRGLCRGDGAELLDLDRIRRRRLRRDRRPLDGDAAPAPTAPRAPCIRAMSCWPPASAAFRTGPIFRA